MRLPHNLISYYYFSYNKARSPKLRSWCDRLFQLQSLNDEETAAAILEALGRLKRPYLNPLEEKLLQFLEEEAVNYGFFKED